MRRKSKLNDKKKVDIEKRLKEQYLPSFKPELMPKREGARTFRETRHSMAVPRTAQLYGQAEANLLRKEKVRIAQRDLEENEAAAYPYKPTLNETSLRLADEKRSNMVERNLVH